MIYLRGMNILDPHDDKIFQQYSFFSGKMKEKTVNMQPRKQRRMKHIILPDK